MAQLTPSLTDIARQAMLERGLLPDFPKAVVDEVAAIPGPAEPVRCPSWKDLRQLDWISIDNDDSKDLDQLTYLGKPAANGNDTIYIAVADVDGLVKRDSQTDRQAAHNTTSVYTPTINFPMLPIRLSTDLTSLNPNVDRTAIVIEIEVDSQGQCPRFDVYPAWVHNHAKLTYNAVTDFLTSGTALPAAEHNRPEIQHQLHQQDVIAQRIQARRERDGALAFASLETHPIASESKVVGLEIEQQNRAQKLIENWMVSANVAVTQFLANHKQPTLRRSVRVPERWNRIVAIAKEKGTHLPGAPDGKALQAFLIEQQKSDPDTFPDLSLTIIKLIGSGEYVAALPGETPPGHFDLGLQDYSHTTAPNRRYPDLIVQRLLKSFFYQTGVPYTLNELQAIAQQCTQREDDVAKVERRVRKSAAALYVADQIGKSFKGIVTGASEKGTWVRTTQPPLEGKLVQGFRGVDVGDHVTVTLVNVDVAKGFIDFAR